MRKLIQSVGLAILGRIIGSHIGVAMFGTAVSGTWPLAIILAIIGLLI
ncbi:hypothetical protein [Marinitoga aeolica]|uniref:Uncharacterized protein n=1 Tax=Marinitoga aeolica TaxID=2809031 RepID=A0ABY8PRE4_9BACT|nr:hypothetical protein [Marinitoga aeolica]WGS65187.1 hypothetical protein JRV97_01120 [Marinitoga aeolica]